MIAYKATNNGKCINITYEVGKTYTFEGDLIVCQQGFHFCKNIADVFDYYLKDKSTKIFEIEVLGDIINSGNKSVTNKFKILKEIDFSGKTLESKDKKLTFDKNNNLIYEKNSKGFWIKYEFDKNNNLIYYEDSNGFWEKYEFDKNNNLIYEKNSKGFWIKYEYDKNNNLVYKEDSKGFWIKYEFDKNNNLIYEENYDGYWIKYEYDSNNNRIYHENSDGLWEKKKYDSNNNLIYKERSNNKKYSIKIS